MKKILSILLTFVMVCISLVGFGDINVNAEETAYTPIYTVADLYAVNNDPNGNYILMNDLDLGEATAEGGDYDAGGKGWTPIKPFGGIFDGNGFSINNMRIVASGTYSGDCQLGLFSCIGTNGLVKNLTVSVNIDVQACKLAAHNELYCGGIAGKVYSGSVSNCAVSGTISFIQSEGYHLYYVGGLVGGIFESGKVTKCLFSGDINIVGTMSTLYCGGIAGGNVIYDDRSYGDYYIYKGGSIKHCYNSGNINYESGEPPVLAFTGGIAGKNYDAGTSSQSSIAGSIAYCYNSGKIFDGSGKAIVGINATTNNVDKTTNSYYLVGSGTGTDTALSETQMLLSSSFIGFDFAETWIIDPHSPYPYPQIRGNRQDTKNIELIKVTKNPNQTDYWIGDSIVPDGGKLTIYYKDGSSKVIDMQDWMFEDSAITATGTQSVIGEYLGMSFSFNINVTERPTLLSVTLSSAPIKTQFVKGTEFDFTGASARAIYDDGSVRDIPITADKTTGGNINALGTQTISFTYDDETVTFDVEVIPVEVTSITVTTPPTKTSFVEGKTISTDGMVVTANYNNGTSQIITNYEVGELPTTIGTHDITVSYSGCITTFQVKIVPKTLITVKLKTNPDRTSYVIGQSFDPKGMVIEGTYDNGTTEEITDFDYPELPKKLGSYNLAINCSGLLVYVPVNIVEKAMESISIKQLPDKVTFVEGETFSSAGIEVVAKYNDGTEVPVSDYTLSGNDTSKTGTHEVTITFDRFITSYSITVVAKSIIDLNVTAPIKTEYVDGEAFDSTGMVVKAVYNNGKSEIVTNYTMSGFGDSDEANTITIEYKGKTKSFVVNIHRAESSWRTITPKSCTTDGEKGLYCASCGKLIRSEKITASGHDWGSWVTVTGSTCTQKGSKKHTCRVCELTEYEDVDVTGHAFASEFTIDQKATCTEAGSKSKHCTNPGCEVRSEVTEIPAKGHDEKSDIRMASIEDEGYIRTVCNTCGAILEDNPIKKISGAEPLDEHFVYNGRAQEPEYLVTDSINHILKEGTDYDITYTNNINAGTARAFITFKGKYTGSIIEKFTIETQPLNTRAINLSSTDLSYDGTVQKPTVVIAGLTENLDYIVDYSNPDSKNVGEYTVFITGIGNYSGSGSINYRINTCSIPVSAVSFSAQSFYYTGKVLKPTVKVDGLTINVDYKVTYSNASSKNPGSYKVTVTGIGNYIGSQSATYKINVKAPAKPSITKLTAAVKGFTAKWSKKTCTGYQLRYSLKSSMASSKTLTISKASTVSKKVTKLKAKKKYYVQLRTYKTIASKKYYSAWSTKKTIKTK